MAIIKEYGHLTSPMIFRGKNEKPNNEQMFGVEIEILKGENNKVSPWHCLRAIEKTSTRQQKNFIDTVEYDSSVDTEFKTEAFTMEAWNAYGKKRMEFFFEYLVRKGYVAWKNDKCGMHIHVSPCSNFDFLCEQARINKDFLFNASGRIAKDNRFCNWNYIGERDKYVPIRYCDEGHYEFRLWRGSLSVEMLNMYLQLTNYMVKKANARESFIESEMAELLIQKIRI